MDQDTRKFDNDPDQPTRRLDAAPEQKPKGRYCSKCNGEMMEVEIHVPGASGYVEAKRPGVWFGLNGGISQIGGFACTNCGFIEFYAIDPAELNRKG